MKYPSKLISFFLLGIISTLVAAEPVFRNIGKANGLADMVVNALYKDSDGYVWIGTGSSVERFDGVHLKHYALLPMKDAKNLVNVIAEMPGKKLWMGSEQGLWRLDRNSDQWVPFKPEVISRKVNTLLMLSEDTLLAGTQNGLLFLVDDSVTQVKVDGEGVFANNEVMAATLDGEGGFWFTSPKGLHRYHKGQIINYGCRERGERYLSIAKVNDRIFLGTSGQGLVEYDISRGHFARYIDVGCNIISALSSDGKDFLYVATNGGGIQVISVGKRKVVNSFCYEPDRKRGLSNNSVYSLLVDRDGLIWAGLFQAGLDYTLHQNPVFDTYQFSPFFDSLNKHVRTFAMHGSEKFIGTNMGAYYIDEKQGIVHPIGQPEIRSNMIICSLYWKGRFYFGTFGGGMYVFDSVHKKAEEFDVALRDEQVFAMVPDEQDRLWIGTSTGLYCYEEGKLVAHYEEHNSKLPGNMVYCIYFDSCGRGWIGTNKGLAVWEPFQKAICTDLLPDHLLLENRMVRVIYEDSAHNLYFVPTESNLCVVDSMLNVRPVPDNKGLFTECLAITEDEDHGVWLVTNGGLYCYRDGEQIRSFSLADVIPSALLTACVPVKDDEGNLWFGCTKGLLRWNRYVEEKTSLYPLQITGVNVNGYDWRMPVRQEKGTFSIHLAKTERNVTIYFSDFSYRAVEALSYEYRLEGVEKEWKKLEGKSSVTYYDLPSGTHRWLVRQPGDAKSEIALILRVASSWESSWAILGIVIVLLGGIGYSYWRKNKRVKVPLQKYQSNKLTDEECQVMNEKLKRIMEEQKPYTNPKLTLADLAKLVGTSTHNLSFLFNQYLNCGYSEYINNYRVKEFQHILLENEDNSYTLLGLAEQCGFNSKNVFFRHFKRVAGCTPSEYIKEIKKRKSSGNEVSKKVTSKIPIKKQSGESQGTL